MLRSAEELIAQGQKARGEQRLEDAFRAYQESAELSRVQGLEQCLILALSGLGQIACDRGSLDTAQQHYAEALAACRSYGKPLIIAHTARHLGDIYRENGLTEQAEPLLKEAIAIYRQNPNTEVLDLANAIRPLALLRTKQGKDEDARPLWNEALALYSAINISAGVAECSVQLANLRAAT
jgi:tetratricopeptide (TPR) repeat protein